MLHFENVITSFTLLGNDLYLPFPAGTLLLTLWFLIDEAHSVYSIDYYTACALKCVHHAHMFSCQEYMGLKSYPF